MKFVNYKKNILLELFRDIYQLKSGMQFCATAMAEADIACS